MRFPFLALAVSASMTAPAALATDLSPLPFANVKLYPGLHLEGWGRITSISYDRFGKPQIFTEKGILRVPSAAELEEELKGSTRLSSLNHGPEPTAPLAVKAVIAADQQKNRDADRPVAVAADHEPAAPAPARRGAAVTPYRAEPQPLPPPPPARAANAAAAGEPTPANRKERAKRDAGQSWVDTRGVMHFPFESHDARYALALRQGRSEYHALPAATEAIAEARPAKPQPSHKPSQKVVVSARETPAVASTATPASPVDAVNSPAATDAAVAAKAVKEMTAVTAASAPLDLRPSNAEARTAVTDGARRAPTQSTPPQPSLEKARSKVSNGASGPDARASATAPVFVSFAARSAALNEEQLELIVTMIRDRESAGFLISGSANMPEDPAGAQRLAMNRALETRRRLIARGVDPKRLDIRAALTDHGQDGVFLTVAARAS